MRVTSKGQITIPAEIRKRAGLAPGTEVKLTFDGEAITIARADRRSPGARIVAHLRGCGDVRMSTDEIRAHPL
jgi:AbrB family looped-hinge helix DNA binding protein